MLLYLVELVELGARLATAFDVSGVRFVASLNGIAGRELISGDWTRDLHQGSRIAVSDRLTAVLDIDAVSLLSDPRGCGVELTQQLLRKFGINISNEVLQAWQEEVFKGYRG